MKERLWLIKNRDHSFSRPIPESELIQKIQKGELQQKDEICAANSYWFSLQDIKEMRKHFGNIPLDGLAKKIDEEITLEKLVVTKPIAAKAMPKKTRSAEEKSPLTKAILVVLTLLAAALIVILFLR